MYALVSALDLGALPDPTERSMRRCAMRNRHSGKQCASVASTKFDLAVSCAPAGSGLLAVPSSGPGALHWPQHGLDDVFLAC